MIEPLLDAIQTPLNSVDATGLVCDLRLEMTNLSRHVSHRGFKGSNSRLEVAHIAINPIHHTPDMPKMFKNDAFRFTRHLSKSIHANLAPRCREKHHTASAPEMISINSLVIIA